MKMLSTRLIVWKPIKMAFPEVNLGADRYREKVL